MAAAWLTLTLVLLSCSSLVIVLAIIVVILLVSLVALVVASIVVIGVGRVCVVVATDNLLERVSVKLPRLSELTIRRNILPHLVDVVVGCSHIDRGNHVRRPGSRHHSPADAAAAGHSRHRSLPAATAAGDGPT